MSKFPVYLKIAPNINSRTRLAWMKRKAEEHNARVKDRGIGTPFASWRNCRFAGMHNAQSACITLSQGFNDKGQTVIWYTHCGPEFRDERYSDEIVSSMRHKGWYSDACSTETVRGIVARLPHGRFISGYVQSDNDERVYFPTIFDDEREAALSADGEAERTAEESREYDEKWQAARQLEDDTEDALQRLRECLALRHRECMSYVRDEIGGLLKTIRENRERLQSEFADVL